MAEDSDLEPEQRSAIEKSEGNDPLITDRILIRDLGGFEARTYFYEFQVDFSAFTSLVRASYVAHSAFDRDFRKYVSCGMYQYYCVIILWKRLMFIAATTKKELSHDHQVKLHLSFELPVPTDVALYINSVGSVRDYSDRFLEFDLQASFTADSVMGAQGTYGRIGEKTAIVYETLPSPFVALEKMRQDLLYTLKPDVGVDWDLPDSIRPAQTDATLPNANLLGWAPSETLTAEQRSAYADAGISELGFGVKNIGRLPVNQMLMKYVAGVIENSTCQMTSSLSTSSSGSAAQIPYAIRSKKDSKIEDTRGVGSKLLKTVCYCPTSKYVASGAATFRFRVQRRSAANEVDTLCYRFAKPPDAWLANENKVFNAGDSSLWNVHAGNDYRISLQDGSSLHTQLAMRVRRKVSRNNACNYRRSSSPE